MSSSNLVQVTYLKEAEYGKRPDDLSAVTMDTARMTSESLSGTPATTESSELRTDRMSSGQVVTGLEVTGGIDWELSADGFFDDFFEAAMMSGWVAAEILNTTVDLFPDPVDDQKAVMTLGDEFANLVPGVLCSFTPTGATLPVIVQITSVDTPSTVFTVATKRGEESVSEALDVSIPQHVDIGTTQISYLIAKAYTDVTVDPGTDQRSQTYNGELVSGFTLNAEYGSIVTGNFDYMGNGYTQEAPSFAQQVETAGGTINPAGTANPINASIDVPLVTADDVSTDFCVETFSLTLDNGLSENTCIGKAAPQGYDLGTASISVSMSIYNSDTSYGTFMPAKLTQAPISMTYILQNMDGGYAFHIEALQLSFPDPAAEGQDESTMLEAEGVGKVGDNGESALRIYRL